MPSSSDVDDPQMKAAWEAFLADLEEEAQAYTRELVDTYRQIGQKDSVVEAVRRLVEHNPYHDRRGRFSRGGHGRGGRKVSGPVTSAVSAAISAGALPGVKRISATVGVTNNLLKGHQFKAVSLTHGGVRLVHTGNLTGTHLHRAESDAIQHLEGHGAKFRYHKPTGQTHLTHYENPTEEAASTHVVRVKTKRATTIDRKMTANEQATDARVKMLAWHEQRQADIVTAYDRMGEMRVLHRRAAENWWLHKDAHTPQAQAAQAEMNRLAKESKAAVDHWNNLHLRQMDDLKEKFIYQKPSDIRMELGKGQKMSAVQKEEWKAGFEEFRKIIGPALDDHIAEHRDVLAQLDKSTNFPGRTAAQRRAQIKRLGISEHATVYFFNTSDDRSFNRMGQVHMGPNAGRTTVVHELGHTLEYQNPAVAKSRREFYDERTRGETEKKMKDVTGHNYTDDEMTRPDDFAHAYMGKEYMRGQQAVYLHTREDRHSEMVSMGLQMLHENPVKLAQADPEYFDWIYSVTRGRAAEWHPAPRFIHGDTVRLTGGTHKGKTATVTGKGFPGTGTEAGRTIHSVEIPGVGLWTVDKGNMVRVQ